VDWSQFHLLVSEKKLLVLVCGANVSFSYGTTFFQQAGVPLSVFKMGIITTVVDVISTPISFWTIERFGRRPLLIWGALGML
jgi:hypothetical protein